MFSLRTKKNINNFWLKKAPYLKLGSGPYRVIPKQSFQLNIRVQLFKTNDVVSYGIVKTLIIKYGIHANIFAEKV